MNEKYSKLIEAATAVRKNAYAPYSKYLVGSAIESSDGRIFVGCNVENACYNSGFCAERAALTRAVSEGAKQFVRIVVVTQSDKAAAPCGACRQALAEFSLEMEVVMVNLTGDKKVMQLNQLLPEAFTPAALV